MLIIVIDEPDNFRMFRHVAWFFILYCTIEEPFAAFASQSMFSTIVVMNRLLSRSFSVAVAASKKKDVVIVGCGWAGFRLAQDIDKTKYNVKLVSPRNYFLFTPLLPSTAVGTLEFRCIQEPVRTIPKLDFYQASVNTIDFDRRNISCVDTFKSKAFALPYDYLVLAPGSETNTFNIPGVENNEHVFFLKSLSQARQIRNRLLECFERASSPFISDEERRRLLTFVVVGGGPTNVEFASELYDFVKSDVSKVYPDLMKSIRVVIVEASGHILGSFSASLVDYVEKLFTSRQIEVRLNAMVKEVTGHTAVFSDQTTLSFGTMVWSTGIKQVALVKNMTGVRKHANGRLMIDEGLRVLQPKNDCENSNSVSPGIAYEGSVFALGDCAADHIKPLPALAQVASQQAIYLAKQFNNNGILQVSPPPFKYAHLGSMASVGEWKGVFDAPKFGQDSTAPPPLKGFLAFALWRAAYWTKQVSIVNKILIPMYWFKSAVFGRDISRF